MEMRPDSMVNDDRRPGRVVVLIDSSPQSRHALELAARLAGHHKVPLLAVSIEEPERERSMGYSFAREVGELSGMIRPLLASGSQPGPDREVAAIRLAIKQVARTLQVSWELNVRRGRLVEEALALSMPEDCLLLGRVGWSARLGRKLGHAPLDLARQARGTVQICSSRLPRDSCQVAVLIENMDSALTLLDFAAERARMDHLGLVVLVSPTIADNDHVQLGQWLSALSLKTHLRIMPRMTTVEMLHALAEERVVEMVIRRRGAWLESAEPRRILEHLPLTMTVIAG